MTGWSWHAAKFNWLHINIFFPLKSLASKFQHFNYSMISVIQLLEPSAGKQRAAHLCCAPWHSSVWEEERDSYHVNKRKTRTKSRWLCWAHHQPSLILISSPFISRILSDGIDHKRRLGGYSYHRDWPNVKIPMESRNSDHFKLLILAGISFLNV